MKIEIEKDVLIKYSFNFESAIKLFIKTVPPEHMIGLGKIWIVGSWHGKEQKDAYGFYYGSREGASIPTIIINASNVFKGIPKFIFYCLPVVPRLFFARTFYHEIAHHYQRLRYGVKKYVWETEANIYSKKMMLKTFTNSIRLIQIVFSPLIALNKYYKNRSKL